MPQQVVMGGMMMCTFGAAPAPLAVAPTGPPVLANSMPAATIMDFAPLENIPTFGLCSAPTNPVVIAATAAKLGVFTPMPCVPATVAPWVPGVPLVMINKMPALNNTCQCLCMWAGVITFTEAGQMTVMD